MMLQRAPSLRESYSSSVLALSFVLAVMTLTGPASADTIRISGGGHLNGQTKKVKPGKAEFVVVKVDDAMQVAIPAGGTSYLSRSADLQQYRQHVITAGDDAEAHYQLARWCRANSMMAQRNYHMKRAIDLNPNHAEARGALGFKEWKGQWVSIDAMKRAEGMVRGKGGWRVPEALAMEDAKEAANKAAKKWIVEFARLRKMANRGNAEAIAEIAAIEDPFAAEAVARELKGTRNQAQNMRQARLSWVTLLARFKNPTSVEALTYAGLDDPDQFVRDAAIEALKEFGAPSAINFYVGLLKSKKNATVRAAARALLNFPDPELRFVYIDALVTDHSQVITVGGGTGAGFNSEGGGGFSSGAKQMKKKILANNAEVLALLQQIAPEANFRYDQMAWRTYFAEQLNSYHGAIDRDS